MKKQAIIIVGVLAFMAERVDAGAVGPKSESTLQRYHGIAQTKAREGSGISGWLKSWGSGTVKLNKVWKDELAKFASAKFHGNALYFGMNPEIKLFGPSSHLSAYDLPMENDKGESITVEEARKISNENGDMFIYENKNKVPKRLFDVRKSPIDTGKVYFLSKEFGFPHKINFCDSYHIYLNPAINLFKEGNGLYDFYQALIDFCKSLPEKEKKTIAYIAIRLVPQVTQAWNGTWLPRIIVEFAGVGERIEYQEGPTSKMREYIITKEDIGRIAVKLKNDFTLAQIKKGFKGEDKTPRYSEHIDNTSNIMYASYSLGDCKDKAGIKDPYTILEKKEGGKIAKKKMESLSKLITEAENRH